MALEISDAEVNENDLKSGRSANSPVFLVMDRVASSWEAKDADENGKWAAIVVNDGTDRETVLKGLHGAAQDMGLSCQVKKLPQPGGKVKILFRAIPRRTKATKKPAPKK